MRVLIVFNHPAPYKIKQFNALAKIVDLTVIFERDSAKDRPVNFYPSEDKFNFKHVIFHDGYYGSEYSKTNKVRDYIKANHKEFDAIIMNGYSGIAERKAIKYLCRNNIPYILMINGGVIHHKEFPLKRWYKSKYISSASKYLSPSAVADEYLCYYKANKQNIYRYTYSSIENTDILKAPLSKEDKNKLRKELNIPEDKFIFIAPNQFIERKNNVQLINYFNKRDEVLLLIGQGEEKPLYEEMIKENKMDNIYIIDHVNRDTLFKYYKASDAVVSFSKEDIFGHTILEGFASGIPCIASNKILSALNLINNKNGFLIDIDNIDTINNAFDNISNCLKENCLKTAKDNTIDMTIYKIEECIKR